MNTNFHFPEINTWGAVAGLYGSYTVLSKEPFKLFTEWLCHVRYIV